VCGVGRTKASHRSIPSYPPQWLRVPQGVAVASAVQACQRRAQQRNQLLHPLRVHPRPLPADPSQTGCAAPSVAQHVACAVMSAPPAISSFLNTAQHALSLSLLCTRMHPPTLNVLWQHQDHCTAYKYMDPHNTYIQMLQYNAYAAA
jgi:hypothetical protein